MDTWKNNNTQTYVKESYFSEDANNNGESSKLPSDARLVGGTIFYIDDVVDGEYEFFDANGNVIEDVKVGDRPYAYNVITPGVKDKYYVYHDEIYDDVRWTYCHCEDDDYAYESLDTSEGIGSGKTNTETVMSEDEGIYVSKDSDGCPTIWYQLQQVRLAKAGGCDDWFVPSKDEIEELRLAVEAGSVKGGEIAGSSHNESVFTSRYLWSSSERSWWRSIWVWLRNGQYWSGSDKSGAVSVLFTRAF